jgi:hypothetical protein
MKTIEALIQIGSDRTLSMQLPADVATGEYEVVLVLSQRSPTAAVAGSLAIQKIQTLLKQSVEPGHSLADELIQERREAAERE